MEYKYFKPKSVAWWASMVPLCAGLVVAFEPFHGVAEAGHVVRAIFGDVQPAVLINAGIAGIGLRGANG